MTDRSPRGPAPRRATTVSPTRPSRVLAARLLAFEEFCRDRGLKVTPQRREIFRLVALDDSHPDAETLFRRLRRRLPRVSLNTVYRTLRSFVELGLLHALGPDHQKTRFDPNLVPHHHFVCAACHLIVDFQDRRLDGLSFTGPRDRIAAIDRTQVEFRGLCTACARARRGSGSRSSPSRAGTKASRHSREK